MTDLIEAGLIIGFAALCICLIVGAALIFWWFAGYICTTFEWYALDPNCQIITWLVFVLSGGCAVGGRK